jgi:hypothetical protein
VENFTLPEEIEKLLEQSIADIQEASLVMEYLAEEAEYVSTVYVSNTSNDASH